MGEVAIFIGWWICSWIFTFILFGLSVFVIDTIRGYKMYENPNKGWILSNEWIAVSILSVPVAIISWLITS